MTHGSRCIPVRCQLAINVSAGDSVTASVQYNLPSYPNQFLMTITDNTSGRHLRILFGYREFPAVGVVGGMDCRCPSGSTEILPLSEFGNVTFTDAQATIDSTTGPIDDSAWQTAELNMNDPTWNDVMTTSALTDVGSGAAASSSFPVTQTPEPSTLAILLRLPQP